VSGAELDPVRDALITMDEHGRVVALNDSAERVFGSEAVGKVASEITAAPALRAAWWIVLKRFLSGQPSEIAGQRSRLTGVHPRGGEFAIEVTVSRAGDSPARFAVSIRDVTGEHGRGDEVDRRQALLERAEEVAQTGSWEWLPTEQDLRWSDNRFRLLGLEPGEITPSWEYVIARTHPDDRERVAGAIEDLGSGELRPLEYRCLRRDGAVRHLRATLAVVDYREDAPYRLVGSVQDLTDRRWAEREIAAHAAVAEALTEWESLEPGARRLLATLAEALGFVAGAFWVPEDDVLVPRVLWHDGTLDVPNFEAATGTARMPRGTGLPGSAWEAREPLRWTDDHETLGDPRDEAAERDGLKGALAIPALAGDEVLAVVELKSTEKVELTPRLMRSLMGIGYELGQFLDRRRGELQAPLLTRRELELLQLGARGMSGPEIAKLLFISQATVKTHFENMYAKLGVSDRASAVATALRLGLIE
jgi:PAS domain S-box-containing protein